MHRWETAEGEGVGERGHTAAFLRGSDIVAFSVLKSVHADRLREHQIQVTHGAHAALVSSDHPGVRTTEIRLRCIYTTPTSNHGSQLDQVNTAERLSDVTRKGTSAEPR